MTFSSLPKAVLFGSIGTLVETSELQRKAFNAAFAEAGLSWNWGKADYVEMLKQPGGKARIARYAEERGQEVDAQQLHRRKSELFQACLEEGVALRPGVAEVIGAVRTSGVKLGFVTTTSAENVNAIILATKGVLQRSHFDFIGVDDLVESPKPAPAIYQLALETLGLPAGQAIAIEDTPSSAASAVAAGIPTFGFAGAYATGRFSDRVTLLDKLSAEAVGVEAPILAMAS